MQKYLTQFEIYKIKVILRKFERVIAPISNNMVKIFQFSVIKWLAFEFGSSELNYLNISIVNYMTLLCKDFRKETNILIR